MTSKVFRTSVVGMIMLAGILSPSAFAIVPAHSSSSATVQTEQVAAVSYRGEATEVQQAAPKEQPRTGMTQQEKKEYAQENDSFGGGITIIAMVIVILALAILSILFGIFGKISARLLTKKKSKLQVPMPPQATAVPRVRIQAKLLRPSHWLLQSTLTARGTTWNAPFSHYVA